MSRNRQGRHDLRRQGRQARSADARARQPPRAGDRRDRHRQDRHLAGAGGRLLARRRAGFRRRHQGRSLRHLPRSARPRRPSSTRAKSIGFDYEPDQFPVVFWDLFGEQGHPIRATISEMGPLLLARLMDLNEVQEGVLNICFRVADEQGLLLLDLKDLRAMLGYRRRARRRAHRAIRQRDEADHRHHPAPAAGAGEPGRRQILRRAGAGAQGFHAHRPRRPRLSSTSWPPTS